MWYFPHKALRRRLCSAERYVWLPEALNYSSVLLIELLVINFTALRYILHHEAAQAPTSTGALGPNRWFVIKKGKTRNSRACQWPGRVDLQQQIIQVLPSLSGAKSSALSKFPHQIIQKECLKMIQNIANMLPSCIHTKHSHHEQHPAILLAETGPHNSAAPETLVNNYCPLQAIWYLGMSLPLSCTFFTFILVHFFGKQLDFKVLWEKRKAY